MVKIPDSILVVLIGYKIKVQNPFVGKKPRNKKRGNEFPLPPN
jgi:hypothetical protein